MTYSASPTFSNHNSSNHDSSNHNATADNSSYQQFYRQADRFFSALCAALLVVSLLLANWYDTWAAALLIGLPALIVPLAISQLAPGSRFSRISFACALMIFAALQIHQTHGLIEMHFGIFALLATLLYYRDITTIIAAAGLIAVHHLAFNYLQEGGAGVWVFENRTGISIVLLHAVFVIVESAALIFLAHKGQQELRQSSELHDIGAHLNKPGAVDLTFQLANPKGEFSHCFNQFFATMHQLVSEAEQLAERINHSGSAFAQSSQAMSDGAQQQFSQTDLIATATTQMSSSMNEVNSNSRQAADAAQLASNSADTSESNISAARNSIEQLAANIERANTVIAHLDSESTQIGSVLSVIQGIAEQTNLLALNAAIEAARAGEQGRGFAVVADEVRTLASRTHESTEEIQSMIERLQKGSSEAVEAMTVSQSGVTTSVEQINQSSEDLQAMKAAVADIYQMNQHIAQALEQQSSAINEVNGNVSVIRDISHTTSDQASDSQQESQQLVSMAANLRELLLKVKV